MEINEKFREKWKRHCTDSLWQRRLFLESSSIPTPSEQKVADNPTVVGKSIKYSRNLDIAVLV